MRSALIFCAIGLMLVATLFSCGTWVAQQEESQSSSGLEYTVVRWHWQWHSPGAVTRSLALLGVAVLASGAAGAAWWRQPAPSTAAVRSTRTAEQRRFKRIRCDWPVRYQVRSLPFERQATCVDISEGGMQCLMQECWVRNTPLELRVYPTEGAPVAFSGVVMWAKAAATSSAGPPRHRVGIRFATTASQPVSALLRVLAGHAAPSVGA